MNQARPTGPADALTELLAGNRRFVTDTRIHPHQDAGHRASLAAAQRPFAVLFGCSDSRLAAEIIFDRGLGDLFVVRTAGHVLGPEVLASIDYGVAILGVPLVVVLGHDSCGAVQAAHGVLSGDGPQRPDLSPIVDRVVASVADAYAEHADDLDVLAQVHVRRTVEAIGRQSRAVADASAAGGCAVVGLSYRLADGRTTPIARFPEDGAAAGGAASPPDVTRAGYGGRAGGYRT